MDVKKWLHFFARNKHREQPPLPDFSATCTLPEGPERRHLAESLATFQLGETGEGRKLQRFAKTIAARHFAGYDTAVAMFVKEENRHAEMLAASVSHVGGSLKEKQWTDSCFRKLRRLINFEFELQVLLTAEIIGLSYYALMGKGVPDSQIRNMCRRLVADEVGHLRFHADFFAHRFVAKGPWWSAVWRLQFRAIFEAVRVVAWWDHRRALASYGVSAAAFFRRSRRARRGFLAEMERAAPDTPGIAVEEGSF